MEQGLRHWDHSYTFQNTQSFFLPWLGCHKILVCFHKFQVLSHVTAAYILQLWYLQKWLDQPTYVFVSSVFSLPHPLQKWCHLQGNPDSPKGTHGHIDNHWVFLTSLRNWQGNGDPLPSPNHPPSSTFIDRNIIATVSLYTGMHKAEAKAAPICLSVGNSALTICPSKLFSPF